MLDDGAVRCWGSGLFGQLGYANLANVGDNESPASVGPVALGATAKATAVAAGIYHTCVRLEDRSVRCWGNGADGRLGLCSIANLGDDETPASADRIDLGAGGAACPPQPVVIAPPAVITPPPPPAPGAGRSRFSRRRGGAARAGGTGQGPARLSLHCDQAPAQRPCPRPAPLSPGHTSAHARAAHAAARAARGRALCMRRFARIPGRVTTLAAKADSATKITLTMRAAGTDGSKGPAARSYLIKQSLRPIRTARDFKRAPALCSGACTFDVTALRAELKLDVTDLRRRTTYYYAVAARDNVSKRTGPRSRTVWVRTR